jgi:hypothetical protein
MDGQGSTLDKGRYFYLSHSMQSGAEAQPASIQWAMEIKRPEHDSKQRTFI